MTERNNGHMKCNQTVYITQDICQIECSRWTP